MFQLERVNLLLYNLPLHSHLLKFPFHWVLQSYQYLLHQNHFLAVATKIFPGPSDQHHFRELFCSINHSSNCTCSSNFKTFETPQGDKLQEVVHFTSLFGVGVQTTISLTPATIAGNCIH